MNRSDHLLHLAISEFPIWALTCHHGKDVFQSTDEEGIVESDDCWLMSWWDALDTELLADDGWPKSPSFPLGVKPSDDWSFDNGGTIVYDPPAFTPLPRGDR